jgi:hypothetical protein
MNLYLDEYYKKDSVNKIDYSSLLFSDNPITINALSSYYIKTDVSLTQANIYLQDNCIIIINIAGPINNIHVYTVDQNNNTVRYLQETLISNNAKKFIIAI